MQLWDTAGQEKYRSITKIYYQDAKIAILVYDVTNKASFETMQGWVEDIRNTAPKNIILAVVGNKIDMLGDTSESEMTETQYKEARSYALNIGAIFMIVSAKSSKGVNELFTDLAYKVVS